LQQCWQSVQFLIFTYSARCNIAEEAYHPLYVFELKFLH
jgi:hypothetical protein